MGLPKVSGCSAKAALTKKDAALEAGVVLG